MLPVVLEALIEEKWHNWYRMARFLYKTSAHGEALARMPQSLPLAATGSRTAGAAVL